MHRSILTTAIRKGRMTSSQSLALETLFPRYGLTLTSGLILPHTWFPEADMHTLEIGFGMGHSLLEMAEANPNTAYLGIELHVAGIGRVLNEVATHDLQNIKIIHGDALHALEHALPACYFDTVQIFFPDPWPKKKHWKRRLIQPHTIPLMARVLKPGGILHLATDWAPYAEHIMCVLSASPLYINLHGHQQFAPRPAHRPFTKFEQRGLRQGHPVFDLEFKRQS